MVNEAETNLDEIILQIFEQQEDQFYWPITSQKVARAFVKALNGKGIKYDAVSAEIEEFSSNFTAWRKGLGRLGIGNRVIERINRPLQEVLQSDDEDDAVVEKVRKFKASRANGDRPRTPSPELENRLHSKGEVSKEQKKDIQESWLKNIEKKTDALKKGDSNGNVEGSTSSGRSSASSTSASRSTSATSSSSSSVEREVKVSDRLSEERSSLRKVNRSSKVEPVAEDVVFARTGTSKEGDAVVAQANMKPSDILKRQSPQRSVSPVIQKSPTPKREQSPLVDKSIIPEKATQAKKVSEEPLPEPREAKQHEKEEEEPLPESAKEKKAKVEEEPLPDVGIDADEEEEELFRDSSKQSRAPKADAESLSSSSSSEAESSSSSEEEEEEEEEDVKDAKKKEESSSSESSSSEEESEDKEKSDEEKGDKEKKTEEKEMEIEEKETTPAVKVTPAAAAESEDEEDEDEDEEEDELVTENYDSDLDKDTGNTSDDFRATRKYISAVKENDADGPGYIYVLTDSARDATHNRMKVDASRYPEKRLEQATKFNLDMRLHFSVPVSERKAALIKAYDALEKYRMDHQRNWFYGLPDKIVNTVKKECEKFVSETSDC